MANRTLDNNITDILSSKVLIPGPTLVISPSLAEMIGLNESIILQQIQYWMYTVLNPGNQNKSDISRHIHDGNVWIYNTISDWQKQFPWWSDRTIIRAINKLEEKGYIKKGNYNKLPIDRTTWYTIDRKKLNADYEKFIESKKRDISIMTICHNGNGQIVIMDTDNLSVPIPEITTKITNSNISGDILNQSTTNGNRSNSTNTHVTSATTVNSHSAAANGTNGAQATRVNRRSRCDVCKSLMDKDTDCYICEMLDIWKQTFPDKAQPRRGSNKSMRKREKAINILREDEHFVENWQQALKRAQKSRLLHQSGWFDFDWFIKDAMNYEKCLNGNYDDRYPTSPTSPTSPGRQHAHRSTRQTQPTGQQRKQVGNGNGVGNAGLEAVETVGHGGRY